MALSGVTVVLCGRARDDVTGQPVSTRSVSPPDHQTGGAQLQAESITMKSLPLPADVNIQLCGCIFT